MAIEANTGLSGTAGTASSGVTIATWANFPAASSVPSGTVYMASDYNNSEWVSNGAYWKPRGGRQRPFVMAAAVSSTGTTSEVNAWAPTIPAGMLFPLCTMDAGFTLTKSGVSGSTTMRWRYNGAAGTHIAHGLLAVAANVGAVGLSRLSAGTASMGDITLTQGMMNSAANGQGFTTATSVSVTHTMANAVTLNLTLQAGSTADTINITSAYLEICG